mmetsp:Transcript_26106/g.69670  ORF Transcript_26106/g.69670 Transcript_26106/m.69670 type:complete len:123 (-) Transcript_26106:364-732(-)
MAGAGARGAAAGSPSESESDWDEERGALIGTKLTAAGERAAFGGFGASTGDSAGDAFREAGGEAVGDAPGEPVGEADGEADELWAWLVVRERSLSLVDTLSRVGSTRTFGFEYGLGVQPAVQ